ncbi:MAG: hypothetical protein FJ125_10710, partial [Deltaproteobacteria bacterium]|nr:hypothetical protein [Deltaproteobacteria bacterium]
QLENELLRALALTPPGLPLTAEVLSGGPRGLGQQDERQLHAAAGRELPLREAIAAFEREYLRAVLSHHGGNRTHAAEMLEISRQGLQKLLRRHGIQD